MPTEEEAELLALSALGWIVSDDGTSQAFLEATGVQATELPGLAAKRSFQCSVLEFLTSDDSYVLAFASASNIEPTAPLFALNRLKGRAGMHWT